MAAPSEVIVVAALRTELLFVRGPKAALGVGERAGAALQALLKRRSPKGVAVVGYAGGLRADLRPGVLVLADRVLDEKGGLEVDPALLRQAQKRLPKARIGPLFTDRRLTPREEKEKLGERALAVDMETSHLARVLSAQGIPFLALRVILDAYEEEAPGDGRKVLWAGRALRCSWILGRAAEALREALCAA